ncbi:hypothetical protein NQ318_013289 [Aromia moschata]|uniref:AAA+ ATPase domain-containing protein n=1 Tax=Aromia moschata TaxID=1265417 RepID=A0AAV8XTG5_9CUCU|nr:hypothetical protein NQ318_013289 [Aromia moschata]
MAEISIIPKRSLRGLPNLYDKTKTEVRERKRNILYLIFNYLVENRLLTAAEALQNEAQLSDQYQACENIDLDIMLQEYQSYYYTKFQKYPKIVRRVDESETGTPNRSKKKPSAKQRAPEGKEKYASPSESEDFQFEIIPLSDNPKVTEKVPYDCANRSNEWQEAAERISKEFVPNNLGVTWKDCVGLDTAIEKLKEATVYPMLYPELFKNLPTWKGVLLYGPPGTGKTLLAKALASEGSTTFVNVTSGTFVSKWRGESERMLGVLFDLARQSTPTTIFIDELDALASGRSQCQHEASRRFKSELLTQIDGITSGESGVLLLASTNAPWDLDPALLRRFEKRILVELPDEGRRQEIFRHHLGRSHCLDDEDFRKVAVKTEGFSGSDLRTLCKEVAMRVVREEISQMNKRGYRSGAPRKVNYKDVEGALETMKPCTTPYECEKYREWRDKYGSW